MYRKYGKKVAFFIVYIREAHPIDGWRSRKNDRQGIAIKQHRNLEQRCQAATSFAVDMLMTIPILIDNMDNKVDQAYRALPDRLYIIAKGGKVYYRGDPGPRGFRPLEMEKHLRRHLAQLEKR